MKYDKRDWYFYGSIWCFFIVLFICLLRCGCPSDFGAHMRFAVNNLESENHLHGNFLFYLLVNVFSGFTGMWPIVKLSFCGLLAAATTWKLYLTDKCIFPSTSTKFYAISLLFVFVIPILMFLNVGEMDWFWMSSWYLDGYYVPNIWHNSTTIFLFPFALLLLLLAIKQIETYDTKRNLWITLLIILNIWIKPSYFFVFACVYPCFLLWKYGFNKKEFYFSVFPLVVGVLVLFVEYVAIFINDTNISSSEDSSVVISFNTLFSIQWWKEKFIYVLVSLCFPLAYTIVHWKESTNDKTFGFIWLQMFVAIGIYLLCHETGARASHGNFYWQIVICTWLLYCYSLKGIVLSLSKSQGIAKIDYSLLCFYALHVLFGILYIVRILFLQANF